MACLELLPGRQQQWLRAGWELPWRAATDLYTNNINGHIKLMIVLVVK